MRVSRRRAVLLLLTAGFSVRALPALQSWYRSDAGVQARGANSFASASSQYHSRADDASLSMGDIDFAFALWGYFTTVASIQTLLSKYTSTGNNLEYLLFFNNSGSRLNWRVDGLGTGGATTTVQSASSSITSGQHYFIFVYHDAVANTLGISLNGGAFVTAAHTTGCFNGTSDFRVGADANAGSVTNYLNGRVAHLAVFKNPVGGGAALWATMRDRLYNSGAGSGYYDLTDAEKTQYGLVEWWRFQEPSTGDRTGAHAGLVLTNNNGVTGADGPIYLPARADEPVARWMDQSSKGNHLVQATMASRPLYKTGVVNGQPALYFDGANDFLQCAAPAASQTDNWTLFAATKVADAGVLLGVGDLNGGKAQTVRGDGSRWSAMSRAVGFGNDNPISSQTINASTTYVLSARRSTAENELALWENGTQRAVDSALLATAADYGTTPVYQTGVMATGSPSYQVSGHIFELAHCATALSVGQRKAMERYLGKRLGVVTA